MLWKLLGSAHQTMAENHSKYFSLRYDWHQYIKCALYVTIRCNVCLHLCARVLSPVRAILYTSVSQRGLYALQGDNLNFFLVGGGGRQLEYITLFSELNWPLCCGGVGMGGGIKIFKALRRIMIKKKVWETLPFTDMTMENSILSCHLPFLGTKRNCYNDDMIIDDFRTNRVGVKYSLPIIDSSYCSWSLMACVWT